MAKKYCLTPVKGDEKSFDVNPDGPNFTPDKYKSASLTIQSNDRCIAQVFSQNYNRDDPEPFNNISETVLFDKKPLNLDPVGPLMYTPRRIKIIPANIFLIKKFKSWRSTLFTDV